MKQILKQYGSRAMCSCHAKQLAQAGDYFTLCSAGLANQQHRLLRDCANDCHVDDRILPNKLLAKPLLHTNESFDGDRAWSFEKPGCLGTRNRPQPVCEAVCP